MLLTHLFETAEKSTVEPQDLVPEQLNPEDYDDYEDEDEDLRLRSGDYVRDTQDGEHGEVFRMQGDPYERRVRILDRDGKGWYIEPSRLTRVDPQDPDVQRYFGKQRQRDMDEMDKSQPSQERHGDRALGAKGTTATPVAARKVVKDLALDLDQAFAKQKPVKKKGVAEESRGLATQQGQRDYSQGLSKQQNPYFKSDNGKTPPAAYDWEAGWEYARDAGKEPGMAEGWSDAMVARRTGGARTPYSVYIKGRKWKDFENEDHAEAVANKLRAKFRADGRDPETITIAPADMSEARATKTRLDPKCWTGKKIGNPKTKVKGGVRVNNCVPAESVDHAAEAVEKTATGLRHRAAPGVYGGADRDEDPLRTLDKPGTNRIERSLGVKFDREKKYQGGVDVAGQELDEVSADTLGRYVKLAGADAINRASASSYKSGAAGDKYNKADTSRQEVSRERCIDRAITRLTR
jgi:hypothetical protein